MQLIWRKEYMYIVLYQIIISDTLRYESSFLALRYIYFIKFINCVQYSELLYFKRLNIMSKSSSGRGRTRSFPVIN